MDLFLIPAKLAAGAGMWQVTNRSTHCHAADRVSPPLSFALSSPTNPEST
jgi:hypothetical protein